MSNSKNDGLRFPSGMTVKRLKIESKRLLAEHPSLKLHEAQRLMCHRNGLSLPLNQAIPALLRAERPKIPPADNAANITNANLGMDGTNRQYDQNQGNRGKQKNPNQELVVFRVPEGILSDECLAMHKLRHLNKGAARSLVEKRHGVGRGEIYLNGYDYIQFTKPMRKNARNTSGALQRIKAVMTGKLEWKQSSEYWIGYERHVDSHHPDEDHDEFHYCPAIDGYY